MTAVVQAIRLCTAGRSRRIVVVLASIAVLVPVTQSTFDYLYHGGKLHRGLTTSRWITVVVFFVVLPLTTLVFNVVVIHAVRRARKDSHVLGHSVIFHCRFLPRETWLLG